MTSRNSLESRWKRRNDKHEDVVDYYMKLFEKNFENCYFGTGRCVVKTIPTSSLGGAHSTVMYSTFTWRISVAILELLLLLDTIFFTRLRLTYLS